MKYIKTKKAFTLAELTIAISIVGVLAAIVVPAVHNMAPNKEMIMFKKAYGEFVRITSEMVNNDDLYPESLDGTAEGFANTEQVDFRALNNVGGATKFCRLFAQHASIRGTDPTCTGTWDFTTQDGVRWNLPSTAFANNANSWQTVCIDVNGDAPPNTTNSNTANRDQFCFGMNNFGRINVTDTLTQNYLTETDMTRSQEELIIPR